MPVDQLSHAWKLGNPGSTEKYSTGPSLGERDSPSSERGKKMEYKNDSISTPDGYRSPRTDSCRGNEPILLRPGNA
ncbi:hypothetical protein HNY73_017422 [Argiope bruennichi]|uniref:Uncharacterized protein n=1 Tax=Argiope bruennichi TaxID=94029 RepID=A0A8T0EAZ9_ARGBR|nr:hypothetical protein HNY73_017422 [Argiope bruennichi]